MLSYEKEVERCFEQNPELLQKSVKKLSEFFLIQGELRFSLVRKKLEAELEFYKCRLQDADTEAYERAKEAIEGKPEKIQTLKRTAWSV